MNRKFILKHSLPHYSSYLDAKRQIEFAALLSKFYDCVSHGTEFLGVLKIKASNSLERLFCIMKVG